MHLYSCLCWPYVNVKMEDGRVVDLPSALTHEISVSAFKFLRG